MSGCTERSRRRSSGSTPTTSTSTCRSWRIHFGEAADTDLERAIEYARRAGEAATNLHSYEEAAAHFERALDWLDASGRDDPRLHCELLIGLSTVQVRSIGQDTARETIRTAIEPARALGDHDLFTRVVLAFAGRYGIPGMADPDVVSLIDEALAMLDESQAAHRGGLMSRLAMEFMLVDPQRSADLATEALRLADIHGDPYLRAHATWIYGWTFAAENPDPVRVAPARRGHAPLRARRRRRLGGRRRTMVRDLRLSPRG